MFLITEGKHETNDVSRWKNTRSRSFFEPPGRSKYSHANSYCRYAFIENCYFFKHLFE